MTAYIVVLLILTALISWALIVAGKRAVARLRPPRLPLGAVVITSPATFAAMQSAAHERGLQGSPVSSVFGMPVHVSRNLPPGVESIVVDRAMLESVPPDPMAVYRADLEAGMVAAYRRDHPWGWLVFPPTIAEANRSLVHITGV